MRNARHLHVCTPDNNDTEEPTEGGHLFEFLEPGCQKVFKSFCELEIHAEIGNHGNRPMSGSFYDRMRREWAEQMALQEAVAFEVQKKTADTPPSDLSQGCAHSKPRVSTRFTPKVMHI